MGLQDRDYMRERTKLREKESKKSEPKKEENKKSEPKKNSWPGEDAKITTLQKTTLIIIGIIITGLLINQTKIATWKEFLEKSAKDDMQQIKNLQQQIRSKQTQETTEERINQSYICIHPGTAKEKCKIIE